MTLGAKDGLTKKDKLSLEEFKRDPRVAAPKFEPNKKFNTYEDRPTEPWHHFLLERGLEGEFILYPDGTVTSKKGLAIKVPT